MSARDPRADPPTQIIRHELSVRSILTILAIGVGCWLLVQVWPIMLLLIIALILAGTLSPMVVWLEHRRVKRGLALAIILLGLVMAIAGLGALVVPTLVSQISNLVASAPTFQHRLAAALTGVPGAQVITQLNPERLLEPLGAYALTLAGAAAQFIILALTTVVLTFYILADHQRVKGLTFALLPRRFHLRTARILADMQVVVGGYVRGQALTSLLMGVVVSSILWLTGTPNPLALGVFAALADLIPFVGGALVLAPAVLATLPQGLLRAALVFAVILGYLQLESHILVPRIYGHTLRLSPLAVVVALLVGGQLMGIMGALLALPIAASLRVVLEQWRIDLPGEESSAPIYEALDAQAEAQYAAQTVGVSAQDAAVVATTMAAQEADLLTDATHTDPDRTPPLPPGDPLVR